MGVNHIENIIQFLLFYFKIIAILNPLPFPKCIPNCLDEPEPQTMLIKAINGHKLVREGEALLIIIP